MAGRVARLDCKALGRDVPRRPSAASRPRAHSRQPSDATARPAPADRRDPRRARPPVRGSAAAHAAARLRRHAARAGRATPTSPGPRPRSSPCSTPRPPAGNRRPHRQRPRARDARPVARPPSDPPRAPSTAIVARVPGGRWRPLVDVDLSWIPRVAPPLPPRRGRRARHDRRAQGELASPGTTGRPSRSTGPGGRTSCSSRSRSSCAARRPR